MFKRSHAPHPSNRWLRVLALIWFAACVGLLVYAYLFRHASDMPVAFTYGLIGLTSPLGIPAGAAVGRSMSWLYANLGLPYHAFGDLVPSWVVMVLAGYVQWFILAPAIARAIKAVGKP